MKAGWGWVAVVAVVVLMLGVASFPGTSGRGDADHGSGSVASPSQHLPSAQRAAVRAAHAAARTEPARLAATGSVDGVAGKRPALEVVQSRRYADGETVRGASARLHLTPVGGSLVSRRIDVASGTSLYGEAWHHVDVVGSDTSARHKESIVARDATAARAFSWQVQGAGRLRRTSSGGLRAFVGARATALVAPPPVVLDMQGRSIPGATARYDLRASGRGGQVLRLRWSVPPGTPFPVNVDPTFTVGQAAVAVIGAANFTDPSFHAGHDNYALGNTFGVAAAGARLLVSEYYTFTSTNRIWYDNVVPTTDGTAFDGSFGNASSGAAGFSRPMGVWSDGTRVAVVDTNDNRVLLWDAFPATANTPAARVLGQPDFTTYDVNTGGLGAGTMRSPRRVWSDGTHLFVSDSGNNRVLVWNSWPTTSGQPADMVLGQPDFTSNLANRGGAVSGGGMSLPDGVWSDGTSLYVSDRSNNRVLAWTSFPTVNGQAANAALGQAGLTTNACNALTLKQAICAPSGLTGSGGSLFVADTSNQRVLRWNSLPTTNGKAADVEIGQKGVAGTTSTLMWSPQDVAVVGAKLAVSDSDNARVLVYDTFPTVDATAADHVIGHPDFVHGGYKDGRGDVLIQPRGVAFDASGRLYVGDGENQTIERFPAAIPAVGATADLSIGQIAPGEHNAGGGDSRGVSQGISIAGDGRMMVGNAFQGRAIWWNSPPTASPTLFNGVLGQSSLTAGTRNRGGSAARNTIGDSNDAAWDGSSHMAAVDGFNHRVLLWNSTPALGAAADVVLGQPDGTSTLPNNGGVSSTTLSSPGGVRFWKGKLVVADTGNNRVLVWNTLPTSDDQPADVVVGQAFMSSNGAGSTASRMSGPSTIDIADGALVVADTGNNRVLIFDSIPTANGASADRVVGQATLGATSCAVTQAGLCAPRYVALRAGRLAVSDNLRRVLVYDDVLAPTVSPITAVQAGQRTTFTFSTDEDAATEVLFDTVSHGGGSGYASSTGVDAAGRSHSLVATGLTPGTTYYYRVSATDSHGNVGVSAEYSVVTSNVSQFDATPSFGDDGAVSEASPDNNYGRSTELRVGGAGAGGAWHSLLRFDLTQLPAGATVTSATLTLHETNAGAGTAPVLAARQVTNAWTEGVGDDAIQPEGTTWNRIDGVDPWTTPGGDALAPVVASGAAPAVAGATMSLNVTSAVANWVTSGQANEGLLLAAASEPAGDTVRFASAESASTNLRPSLSVTWQGVDTTNPQLGTVRIRMLTSTSMEVSWDTDESSTSAVDFGTTTAYTGGTVSDPTTTAHHVVVVTGLATTTLYHVRVRSSDAQGNQAQSGDVLARTSYQVALDAADTFLRSDKPNRNNGAQPSLFVGNASTSWGATRSLLRFDLSSIPAGATIRSAQLQLTESGQADASAPSIGAHLLTSPFAEGTGNPNLAPGLQLTAAAVNGQTPLVSPAERHMSLTSRGWFALTPYFDQFNLYLRYRRSYDGLSFGSDAVLYTTFGRTGAALDPDGTSVWIAGFNDGSSTMSVRSIAGDTTAQLTTGSVAFAAGVTGAPGIRVAADGYLWAKGESSTGAVWVARSSAPRNPAAWGAPVLLASEAVPGHAVLVPLAGSQMALLSQDGSTISWRLWDGTSWGGPQLVASDAAPVASWVQNESLAATRDGSGGVWLAYRTATSDLSTMHEAAGSWSSPEVVQTGGVTAVAASLDTGTGEPYVGWMSGTNILVSHRTAGAWLAPATLQSGIAAGLAQVTMSPPSDEALAVSWAEPSGSNSVVRWKGIALDKAPDGATWNTMDASTAWASPGGDEAAGAPVDARPAPTATGVQLALDMTAPVTAWHAGTSPNDGIVLRKEVDNGALTDWKAFYSAQAVTASLRPHLVVDYDVASVTVSQPNGSTAWRNGQMTDVTWQSTGSGLTQVNLLLSGDGGTTWTPIATNQSNNGDYLWQVAGTTGTYRIKVEAMTSLGAVIASDTSASFVVEDISPSPVTDLTATSPSLTSVLAWSMPADTGGAGMANGTYRIYRSTSSGTRGNRIATVSALTYSDTAPLADGAWYYTVVPVDAAGNAQPVGNVQVAVIHDGQAPNPVTDLVAPALASGSIAFSWSAVSDVGPSGMAGYRLYRSSSAGIRGSLVSSSVGTSTSDTPPTDGTWYYTVVPFDVAGNLQLIGDNQVTTTDDTTAPSPVSLTLAGGAAWTGGLTVTATLGGADAVDYELSESPSFASASWTPLVASTPFLLANSEGGHVVYARYRDLAGNVSATASASIGVDRVAPGGVTPVADGPGPGDLDYQASTSQLRANWAAGTDGGSGVARYEACMSTATACGGTVLVPWGSLGLTTSATFGSLTLAPGQQYVACVRAVDNVGNVGAVTCSDGITVTSIVGVSPGSLPQGRRSAVLHLTGNGLDPAVTASVSGTDVSVVGVTWIDSTHVDVTVNVSSASAPGSRTVTLTSPDGATVSLAAGVAVTAPTISMSTGTLGYDGSGAGPSASGPYALTLGNVIEGGSRQVGTAGSGQATAGAPIEIDVQSDTDWKVSGSAADFTGPAALAATSLAWKHHLVSESWTPFSTATGLVDGGASGFAPNAPSTAVLQYDLLWTIPPLQRAGNYQTTITMTVTAVA